MALWCGNSWPEVCAHIPKWTTGTSSSTWSLGGACHSLRTVLMHCKSDLSWKLATGVYSSWTAWSWCRIDVVSMRVDDVCKLTLQLHHHAGLLGKRPKGQAHLFWTGCRHPEDYKQYRTASSTGWAGHNLCQPPNAGLSVPYTIEPCLCAPEYISVGKNASTCCHGNHCYGFSAQDCMLHLCIIAW